MTARQQKYKDTPYFHYHNANPKNRITTDCVIRAISTATEIPYEQVVMEMAEQQCRTGYDPSENKAVDLYLTSKGWTKQKQPRKLWDGNRKYTGKEFCYELMNYDCSLGQSEFNRNRIIANIGGHHTVAIMSGQVWDIWDSTSGTIGMWWTTNQ